MGDVDQPGHEQGETVAIQMRGGGDGQPPGTRATTSPYAPFHLAACRTEIDRRYRVAPGARDRGHRGLELNPAELATGVQTVRRRAVTTRARSTRVTDPSSCRQRREFARRRQQSFELAARTRPEPVRVGKPGAPGFVMLGGAYMPESTHSSGSSSSSTDCPQPSSQRRRGASHFDWLKVHVSDLR